MDNDKVEQLRQERRKKRSQRVPSPPTTPAAAAATTTTTVTPSSPPEQDSGGPGQFTRSLRKSSASSTPGVATRGFVAGKRRETTAGSVLFDDELRDASIDQGSRLLAGPEYHPGQLPSPHLMDDNPYARGIGPIGVVGQQGQGQGQGQQGQGRPRHRRKVSRSEVDPVVTLSSPAALRTWDDGSHAQPGMRRKVDPAVDPLW